MVNLGPLVVEILSLVWAPQLISTGFASLQHYCTASSSGRQPNFAALNTGRHLCLAGRPSRWALAHILVTFCLVSEILLWNREQVGRLMHGTPEGAFLVRDASDKTKDSYTLTLR